MAKGRIGVGIIGANVHYGWGTRAHLPALQALPEFELVAVCTTRSETAEETARQFAIPHAFGDPRRLAAHPDVDLVLVCVRVPAHHQLTTIALQAGKHVFCEWPLGANLKEAVELRDLARKAGVRHMVGLQARGAPAFVRMRELIVGGYVGEVLSADMYSARPGAGPRRSSFVWAADRTKGASTLSIAAGHSLDALTFCLGEFTELSAVVSTQVPQTSVLDTGEALTVTAPDHVLVNGTLQSGAVVSADVKSVPAHGTGFRMEVHGRDGMLRISSDGGAQTDDLFLEGARRDDDAVHELPLEPRDRWVPEHVTGPPLNVAQLFRRLAERVRDGKPADPDFDHAVRRHELLEAIQRSSDEGQRVRLSP